MNSTERLSHTQNVIEHLEKLISTIKDAETGQRGYIITGNKAYLEPYKVAIGFINSLETKHFLEKAEKESSITEDVKQLKKIHKLIKSQESVVNNLDYLFFMFFRLLFHALVKLHYHYNVLHDFHCL
jgi:CHASE3 domain sensor protein